MAQQKKGTEKSWSLAELAGLVGGTVIGDPQTQVSGFNALDLAREGELTFFSGRDDQTRLSECRASGCLVGRKIDELPMAQIVVDDPDLAAAVIHNHMLSAPFTATGIHESAMIGEDCRIDSEVSIGPLVSIGDRVRIEAEVVLHPGVVVGDDVCIGRGSVLHANAVVARGCTLGQRVVLHHGAVIGSDGFGFATDRKTGCHVSKPQVGTVVLEDDVQVGANACVDRAAFGETRVGAGTRIDNLVMVGHNVRIGENSILVAQVGIAGSTKLGRNVVLGAKAGIAGHLDIGDRVMVAAMGGVHNDQKEGAMLGGIPAIDVRQWGKASAAYRRLPDLMREVRRLRRQVQALMDQQQEEERKSRG